ncbi:MAG: cytochrome c [Bacteroidales bacterium]|nr:cytochrome c [Bacteroidales bacterium]MCF8405974.1 cytochrome c [Bacteroidales bacterium]
MSKVIKSMDADRFKKSAGITLLILFVVFTSCDRNRNNPGWDFFPDMFYSEAYETYSPNPNLKDGKTMSMPVEGSVARDDVPFLYTIEEADRLRAGVELNNPFGDDSLALHRGKEVFTAFCANCHGDMGDGKGFLFTSGKYLIPPKSLIGETGQNLKDGEIYHSITLGFGSMGSHSSQIRPDDRWKAVSYIRYVLQTDAN